MKESENSKRTSSSVWGLLILCAGCIGYVIWKRLLFLVGGVLGFTLLFALKE